MNNQTTTTNDSTNTFGCPSIGLPHIPTGADGVEPMARMDYESVIADVFHKCNEAFIHAPHQREARPGYFKVAVGDLADALASVVPCDLFARSADPAEASRDGRARTPAAPMDVAIDNLTPEQIEKICERYRLKKRMTNKEYMTVATGVELKKFKGTKAVRLVAVRKGFEGNEDDLFEISVDRFNATAVIERNGEMLYQIKTLGLSDKRLTNAAINVLRSHLHENKRVYCAHKKARHIRSGILTPEEELADTIERQKENA